MNYADSIQKIDGYRSEILSLREKIRDLQSDIEPQQVDDYAFSTRDGEVRLSELFGEQDALFVIHNMGAGCVYCTLWADGFNGIIDHLQNRAAFVLTSPDAPDAQKKFAASRGWRFQMVSHQGTSFAEDMGFTGDSGWLPGLSVFKRDGDRIVRVSHQQLGPGDDFCSLWHFLDMLPEGPDGWQPRYKYA